MSLALRTLDSSAPGFDADLAALLAYSVETDRAIEATVESILADVRARGDAAVLEYTRRFDAIDAGTASSPRRSRRCLRLSATRSTPPRRGSAISTSASSRPAAARGAIATATAACSARR